MRVFGAVVALFFLVTSSVLAQDSTSPSASLKKAPAKPNPHLKKLIGDWRHLQILVKSKTVTLKNGKTVKTKPITRTVRVSFKPDGKFVMLIVHTKNRTEKSLGRWKLEGGVILTRLKDDVTWTKTIIVRLKQDVLVVKDSGSGHQTKFTRLN
ncbi:MAG: hypothetical protein KJ621_02535 [Proteobacteria bacterium]|nr:hypothetical protein [Pseudomonadota bacterium]MBU1741082.1 hypothetical protein [Pseudomonadota bacterium]